MERNVLGLFALVVMSACSLDAADGQVSLVTCPKCDRRFRIAAGGRQAVSAHGLVELEHLRPRHQRGAYPLHRAGDYSDGTNGLEFRVFRVSTDGPRRLVFRCRSEGVRTFAVAIDGVRAGEVSVPDTAGAFVSVSLEVGLIAGVHCISLTNPRAPMPDVDRMDLEQADGLVLAERGKTAPVTVVANGGASYAHAAAELCDYVTPECRGVLLIVR